MLNRVFCSFLYRYIIFHRLYHQSKASSKMRIDAHQYNLSVQMNAALTSISSWFNIPSKRSVHFLSSVLVFIVFFELVLYMYSIEHRYCWSLAMLMPKTEKMSPWLELLKYWWSRSIGRKGRSAATKEWISYGKPGNRT